MVAGPSQPGMGSRASKREWTWAEWIHDDWAPVVFVVCLFTVFHHWHALGPVTHLSSVVVANLATPPSTPVPAASAASAAVITINGEQFERRYRERTPLDRCKLKEDLWSIVSTLEPAVIGVDFDLSPAVNADGAEQGCQKVLDDLLDGKGTDKASPKFVLVRPLPASAPEFNRDKEAWRLGRSQAGVAFAHSTLELPLNVAAEMHCDDDRFAETVFNEMHGPCKACKDMLRHETQTVNYMEYQAALISSSVEGIKGLKTGGFSEGRVVFFGGVYGNDDLHLTPIGKRYGVQVHAARYATLLKRLPHRERIAFVFDLVFAALFSIIISVTMHRYARYATSDSVWTQHRRAGVMFGFSVTYVAVIAAALGMAKVLLVHGVVIEPLLIALGLAVDGFVVSPWRQISHHDSHEPSAHLRFLLDGFRRDWKGATCYLLCRVLFVGVIVGALLELMEVLP